MKKLTLSLATLAVLTLISCSPSDEQRAAYEKALKDSLALTRDKRIATSLAMQDSFNQDKGQTSNSGWYCPDNVKGFPPVDIKSWNKVPVVNGRLPTFEETQNGTSLIYYDRFKTPDARPYNMILPKLAEFYCTNSGKEETIIVIQIVQTAKDTVVGYRFLTGGNGTSDFRDIHFLTDNDIKRLTEKN